MEYKKNTNSKTDLLLSNILRAGLFLSVIVVLVGGICYLWHHGGETQDFKIFHGEPNQLTSLWGILKNVMYDNGRGIMQLGIVFMIATPIVRVATCLAVFAFQRDRLYVVISSVVLLALLYSLFLV